MKAFRKHQLERLNRILNINLQALARHNRKRTEELFADAERFLFDLTEEDLADEHREHHIRNLIEYSKQDIRAMAEYPDFIENRNAIDAKMREYKKLGLVF